MLFLRHAKEFLLFEPACDDGKHQKYRLQLHAYLFLEQVEILLGAPVDLPLQGTNDNE